MLICSKRETRRSAAATGGLMAAAPPGLSLTSMSGYLSLGGRAFYLLFTLQRRIESIILARWCSGKMTNDPYSLRRLRRLAFFCWIQIEQPAVARSVSSRKTLLAQRL